MTTKLSRRTFLATASAAGAGLVLSFTLPGTLRGPAVLAAPAKADFAPNAFLKIASDGEITMMVTRVEMGQGVRTSMPMLIAEELECDWASIRIEQADFDPKYGPMETGGSASVRECWEPLRNAGATAREMLIAAAAARWGVPVTQCRAENSAVIHNETGRKFTYSELAADAAKLPAPKEVKLKEPKDFRLIGKSKRRFDGPAIVQGKARYGLDTRAPGMLYASIERTPVYLSELVSFDGSESLRVPGVKHVVPVRGRGVHDGVAVVADSTWAAMKGREALRVQWKESEVAGRNTEQIWEDFRSRVNHPAKLLREVKPAAPLPKDRRSHSATFYAPFLAHATMEPMNCVASVKGDRCEIWSPTQYPGWALNETAGLLQIPPENITFHITLLGGGFGRRINFDFVLEAALVSKQVGAPVQVVWTRPDDMQYDYYRPMSLHAMRGAVHGGLAVEWDHTTVSTPIFSPRDDNDPFVFSWQVAEALGAMDVPYFIPSTHMRYVKAPPTGVPLGWWRAVSRTQNCFVVECFIDELAAKAGVDPVVFRRELLRRQKPFEMDDPFNDAPMVFDPPRLLRVLDLAAERAQWSKPLPKGWGRGIALNADMNTRTYVAQVAECSILPGEGLKVRRVVCAMDCGIVVNPDHTAQQVEGAVIWALSGVLHNAITVRNGLVEQRTFRDYPIPRISEAPQVETHLVASDGVPGGVGEPPVPPVAPAVANAIANITGKRVRRLPFRLDQLEALES